MAELHLVSEDLDDNLATLTDSLIVSLEGRLQAEVLMDSCSRITTGTRIKKPQKPR